MTAQVPDFSAEHALDRYRGAQRDFIATPCKGTGDVYVERAFRFWKALTGSSAGWEAELAFLDLRIKRTIRLHERRTGGTEVAPAGAAIVASFQPRRPRT